MNIDTICVRGRIDYASRDDTGAIAVPIYQSATFAHPALGQSTGYDYSRLKNPTRDYLEKLVASLDHAEFGFAYNCGLAAITALFEEDESTLVRLRDHALKGNWKGYRELHIDADWLLIYQVEREELELVLVRSGSHDSLL